MIPTLMSLEQNFINVCENICKIQKRCGRDKETIRLLAVSKTKPPEMVRELWNLGQRDFGENHVREGVEKIRRLNTLNGIRWHLVGPLQSNKTRQVAENFHWVQSIDRLKIAKRLSEQRPDHLPALNICVQVNVSNESNKSGVCPDNVIPLAESLITLPHLNLRGLMAIPQKTDFSHEESIKALRAAFYSTRLLFMKLKRRFPDHDIDTLSMGMSQDMPLALEEGSTCVRIGTALFGVRS